MTAITVATAEDVAVREAKSLPDLVDKLQVVNPTLAQQFVGKSLAASKTPWGTLLLPVVAYAAARYGLGWGPDVDALVAGVAVLVGSYAMRAVTSIPITGLFHAKALPPAVAASAPIPVAAVGDKP